MPFSGRDPSYLWDMLDAARSILQMVEGRSFGGYLADQVLVFAVDRQLTLLGEAGKRVSDGFRGEHAEIPWRSIIGLRNVLMHEYGDIDRENIWKIVSANVPELIRLLEPLIPPLPPDES